MAKAEELLETGGPGETTLPFNEASNLETVGPLPEFEAKLMAAKDDLVKMGMPYN